MIKTRKNCKVCQTILAQPHSYVGRLANRIYGSRAYTPSSDYSLAQVQREYKDKFSYDALMNHCRKHQFLSEDDFQKRHLTQLANKAEKTILKEAISASQVWDKVIQRGMENLEEGKLAISANNLLSAARDKSNYEIRYASQQLALMDMVYGFASGEQLPNGVRENAIEGETIHTDGTGDDSEAREARSRAFYQSLAGDAPTPGAD